MPSRPSRSLAAVPPAHAHRRPVVHAPTSRGYSRFSILVDLYTELSRQEIGHTSPPSQVEVPKKPFRCHVLKLPKSGKILTPSCGKNELFFQCEKKAGDVWNMCTGTQNCARKVCIVPSILRLAHADRNLSWPRPDLSPTLCWLNCRRHSRSALCRKLRPRSCRTHCSLIGLALCSASCRILPLAHADRILGPTFHPRYAG